MKGRVARRNVHTKTPAREITAKSSRQRACFSIGMPRGRLRRGSLPNIYSYHVVLKAPP